MKTRTFRLNKLVRDNIVADHLAQGGQVEHFQLSPIQKQHELLKKMVEEAKEARNTDELLEELADMQEILDQLAQDAGLGKAQIKAQQIKKRAESGGLKHGDYIRRETWPAGHKWAKYYAADPTRFPEVKNG